MTSRLEEFSLNTKVNDINKWIFCDVKISRYLAKNEKKLTLPSKENVGKNFFFLHFVTSFMKLCFIFIKQLSVQNNIALNDIDHLLLSTGAGHDKKNYLNYISKEENKFITIKAFRPSSYMRIYTISFFVLIKFFFEAIREINKVLSLKLPKELEILISKHIKTNLANYSYFCAIFSKIQSKHPNLIIYHSGATFLSSVTKRIGISTRYFLHGLLGEAGKSSFPAYEKIFVYSNEEVKYLKEISPQSDIVIYPYEKLKNLEKKVLIFLRVDDNLMEINQLEKVISYFIQKAYKVILKPHPTYKGSLATKLSSSHNLTLSNNINLDAKEVMKEENPSFTIGWASTALCESLQSGVIPITLLNEDSSKYDYVSAPPIVYPIQRRCLSWQKERKKINQLISNISDYKDYLQILKSR